MSVWELWRIGREFIAPPLDEVALIHAVLRREGAGVMVDVGAHTGGSLHRFAQDQWRVYAIEPDPSNRAQLARRLQAYPNVTVDGRAVAEEDGVLLELYTSDVSTGISTLTPFHASHRPTTRIETVRLDTFLAGVDRVTFLKTDTEGYDLPVLRTFPWDRLRPSAVVAEFEDRKTVPLGYSVSDMAEYLRSRGYIVFVSEWYPVVEYGQRHRWRRLRPYPAELARERAWGNLVAVDPMLVKDVRRYARWPYRFRALIERVRTRLRTPG